MWAILSGIYLTSTLKKGLKMLNKKVVAVVCVKNRCFAYRGTVTKIVNRWFRKPAYILDNQYKTTQIIRELNK